MKSESGFSLAIASQPFEFLLPKSENGQSEEKNIEAIYETKMYELIFCKALPLATLMKCFNERCCWIISASLLLIWKLFPE